VVVSISGDVKPELLSTWRRYKVAPLTVDQSKAGTASQMLLPLAGDMREVAEGTVDTSTENEPKRLKLSRYEELLTLTGTV
jgi:hypothetical protein